LGSEPMLDHSRFVYPEDILSTPYVFFRLPDSKFNEFSGKSVLLHPF